jgi:hypothetical protein
MEKIILLDIGSSSIKAYTLIDQTLTPLFAQTIHFKDGFTIDGLATEKEAELIHLLSQVKRDHPDSEVKTYATALFRKLTPEAQESLKSRVLEKTGIDLNIISQEEENEYLEKALSGKFHSPKRVILINIGGGSTEVVIVQKQRVMQRQNIDMGVSTITGMFPDINDNAPQVSHEKMVYDVQKRLPELDLHADTAINSGGELTWMKLGEYNLVPNTLFSDTDHPLMITVQDYKMRNKEIFEEYTVSDLEKLMPNNPKWMHGARAYNVLSEAICVTYGIKMLVPSDSNLMNGVERSLTEQ